MSVFSESRMKSLLVDIKCDQNTINTATEWILHHRKYGELIATNWVKEVRGTKDSTRLIALVYLANDIIQNCRKKCPELKGNFYQVLEAAIHHCSRISGPDLDRAVVKVLRVFRDRQIFTDIELNKLDAAAAHSRKIPKPKPSTMIPIEAYSGMKPPPAPVVEYDGETVSRNAKDILESMKKLENPPSGDEGIRHKIAAYPESIANTQMLETIRSETEVKSMLEQIGDAEPLVRDYCQRLADEMLDRRNLQKLFDDMLINVRVTVDRQEEIIKEVKKKEESIRADVADVRKAYESLPDLSTEVEAMDMAPLPTNLFDIP